MEKIIMLGTGSGSVYNLYNTCFILKNNDKNLLVDTGGGVQIVDNLEKYRYSWYIYISLSYGSYFRIIMDFKKNV